MNTQTTPPVSVFLPTAIILALVGWGGLYYLVNNTFPTVGPRWLFFFLSVLAITGSVLPGIAFLNRRFPSRPPAVPGVILRQAIWFGVYGATLFWLQIERVLTPALAFLLAIGFVLIEVLLRMREQSQWKP
jgi:hypothetical protein